MAMATASGLQMATVRPCFSSSNKVVKAGTASLGAYSRCLSWTKLTSTTSHLSSRSFSSSSEKFGKIVPNATAASGESQPLPGLPVDLRGKRAFIAGIADDNG